MDDPLPVGRPYGIGDLTEEAEPLVGGQLLAVCRQVVVEPDGVGVQVTKEE